MLQIITAVKASGHHCGIIKRLVETGLAGVLGGLSSVTLGSDKEQTVLILVNIKPPSMSLLNYSYLTIRLIKVY